MKLTVGTVFESFSRRQRSQSVSSWGHSLCNGFMINIREFDRSSQAALACTAKQWDLAFRRQPRKILPRITLRPSVMIHLVQLLLSQQTRKGQTCLTFCPSPCPFCMCKNQMPMSQTTARKKGGDQPMTMREMKQEGLGRASEKGL
jgi:hypothetical protein